MSPSTGLAQHDIDALVEARHWDAFAVLGAHTNEAGTFVRAMLPGAQRVTVIDAAGNSLGELTSLHPAGLFAGPVTLDPAPGGTGGTPYRLRIGWAGGMQETADAYAFGTLLRDQDLERLSWGDPAAVDLCLGARVLTIDGVRGVRFAVWAPNAKRVSVVGDFNGWDGRRQPMRLRQRFGVWELFVPDIG
ncbi:MAG: GlgB N-terminal domain-containing protein, partial [Janthinobacterium lividum]